MDEKLATPEGIETIQVRIPFTEEFVYTNGSALSLTQFDVRISFAEVMPDKTVHPRIGVVMPVEHAALLFFNLLNLLTSFETNSGPIRFAPWREFFKSAMQEAAAEAAAKAQAPRPAT